MTEAADVPERYRLSYLVGEIVRNDSYAEHEARVLWHRLRAVGLGAERPLREFGRLLSELRRMMRDDRVPGDFSVIGQGAVDELAAAHRLRASLVHDVLMQVPWRDGQVISAIRRAPNRPIQDLADCAETLRRGMYRMRGLWIIAPQWVGGVLEEPLDVPDLVSWTRVAMGHIADTLGIIEGTPGDSPIPPGGWRADADAQS